MAMGLPSSGYNRWLRVWHMLRNNVVDVQRQRDSWTHWEVTPIFTSLTWIMPSTLTHELSIGWHLMWSSSWANFGIVSWPFFWAIHFLDSPHLHYGGSLDIKWLWHGSCPLSNQLMAHPVVLGTSWSSLVPSLIYEGLVRFCSLQCSSKSFGREGLKMPSMGLSVCGWPWFGPLVLLLEVLWLSGIVDWLLWGFLALGLVSWASRCWPLGHITTTFFCFVGDYIVEILLKAITLVNL